MGQRSLANTVEKTHTYLRLGIGLGRSELRPQTQVLLPELRLEEWVSEA